MGTGVFSTVLAKMGTGVGGDHQRHLSGGRLTRMARFLNDCRFALRTVERDEHAQRTLPISHVVRRIELGFGQFGSLLRIAARDQPERDRAQASSALRLR